MTAPSSESLCSSIVELNLEGDAETTQSREPSPPGEGEANIRKSAAQIARVTSTPGSSSNSPIPKRRLLNVSVVPVSSPTQNSPTSRVNQLGRSSPVLSPPKQRSISNSSGESVVSDASSPGGASGAVMAAAREQDSALSKYLSELAAKESHVSELKLRVSELKAAVQEAEQEARAAETDLVRYKRSGNPIMEQLRNNSPSLKHQSVAELSEAAVNRGLSRSPSPYRRTSPSHAEGGAPESAKRENEMLVMGKRVVDELNHQFWSFVEDVKTATIGPEDDYDAQQPALPTRRRPDEPQRRDRGRQPVPRLKPKQSFSNMVENIRKLSPERRPRRSDSAAVESGNRSAQQGGRENRS